MTPNGIFFVLDVRHDSAGMQSAIATSQIKAWQISNEMEQLAEKLPQLRVNPDDL